MVTITESAEKKISELINKSDDPILGLRVEAENISPLKVDYKMSFIGHGQDIPEDEVLTFNDFNVYIDAESLPLLNKATIDYVDGMMRSGFKIDCPTQLPEHLAGPVVQQVQEVIDKQINPGVASHGGRVALIDIKEDIVYVELQGGCQGCGMASVTLKHGIEEQIKTAVPSIEAVYDVTDHANGKNPYYQGEADS